MTPIRNTECSDTSRFDGYSVTTFGTRARAAPRKALQVVSSISKALLTVLSFGIEFWQCENEVHQQVGNLVNASISRFDTWSKSIM